MTRRYFKYTEIFSVPFIVKIYSIKGLLYGIYIWGVIFDLFYIKGFELDNALINKLIKGLRLKGI